MKPRINRAALALIKRHEGLRLTQYKCAAGLPTIGYGHLIKHGEAFGRLTAAQASALLKQDVVEAEQVVARYVKVRLSENQHGALVSWVFNLGAGNFRSSTLLKRLNARQFHRAPGEMMRWVLGSGRPLAGLIARRADEARLFIKV